jgi:hypothetical protein
MNVYVFEEKNSRATLTTPSSEKKQFGHDGYHVNDGIDVYNIATSISCILRYWCSVGITS